MECNKDEATRAKEIAEKKFNTKDTAGAKKFALKAQNLYPGLEGISQMVATLDVHISAENKVSGEADWYGILGLSPQADEDKVRKQYRKLALMLHPDKNKSVGADGAFKLISEAWSVLSDRTRRMAYDQKRNAKVFQKVPKQGGGPSPSPAVNGFFNFTKNTTSNSKAHKSTRASTSSAPASSHKPKSHTFWTVCHKCKMQYEYLRVYLNHNLLCPNCREPFLAIETAPPPSNGAKLPNSWNFSEQQKQQPKSNHQAAAASKSASHSGKNHAAGGFSSPNANNNTNFQWGPFTRTGVSGVGNAAQAATVVQQAYERVKREREEAQAATKREEVLRRKYHTSKKTGGASSSGLSNAAKRRRGIDDVSASSYGRDASHQMGTGTSGGSMAGVSGFKQGNFEVGRVNGITKLNGTRDIAQFDIQNLLMQKSRVEIRKKLSEWNSATVTKSAVNVKGSGNEKANEKVEKSLANGDIDTLHQNKTGESMGTKNGVRSINSFLGTSDAETLETMSMNVPDPDFHDFDKDRTERCFGDNQIWAAYDNDDGMPRYYAMIHSVISLNPFKMRISWLNSKTNSELGPLNWVGSGFSKTCGDFRVGKYEVYNSLNSFSHKVRWTKGTRGAIRIYPRKGDVWALYRNWSPDWNELTADEVIHKYDMVEVLEDYVEELGVTVTPLIKVAGFKTVFHRHLDPREVRRIPREEMFRFSHHVPSYLLTGQEAPNAPKGCRELDPAATPLEHLQVITDVKEEERVEEDSVVSNIEKATDKEMVEDSEKAREGEEGNTKDIQDIQKVGIVEGTKESENKKAAEHDDQQPGMMSR